MCNLSAMGSRVHYRFFAIVQGNTLPLISVSLWSKNKQYRRLFVIYRVSIWEFICGSRLLFILKPMYARIVEILVDL